MVAFVIVLALSRDRAPKSIRTICDWGFWGETLSGHQRTMDPCVFGITRNVVDSMFDTMRVNVLDVCIPPPGFTGFQKCHCRDHQKNSQHMPIGGVVNGRFFGETAAYVDRRLPPGASTIPQPTLRDFLWGMINLRFLWDSPNLLWLLGALTMYVAFPYDLGANGVASHGPLSLPFFADRLPLWFAIVMGYTVFAHVTVYWTGWAKRPLIAGRTYRWSKILHNAFFASLGVVIWVAFENVFVFLWATGRLDYVADDAVFTTWDGFLRFAIAAIYIPMQRDAHFYFAHRMIHFRPLFVHVHALHHRNTDIEPLSGLCMHPVEHLYYFTSCFPSLCCRLSPSALLWNAFHFLLAPAFSHSGYEDHWQSDVYHYYHHRYFELNYAGLYAAFLDVWFGSFWGNGWKEGDPPPIRVRDDAKATLDFLHGPRTSDAMLSPYMGLSAACVGVWAMAACGRPAIDGVPPIVWALSAGAGPVVVACALTLLRERGSLIALVQPFDKRPAAETVIHVVLGTAMCVVPVVAACLWALP